jgi:hypothetical protein
VFVRSVSPAGEADVVSIGSGYTLEYDWLPAGGTWNHFPIAAAGKAY